MSKKKVVLLRDKPRTLGDIADDHWKLELLIDELKDRIKLYELDQAKLEAEALAASQLIDSTAAKIYRGKFAVGEIKERVHPKIADPPKLHAWIKKTGRFEILENRVSKNTYYSLKDDGVLAPGVSEFRQEVFVTRRLKGKK